MAVIPNLTDSDGIITRSRNFVWDVNLLEDVRMTQPLIDTDTLNVDADVTDRAGRALGVITAPTLLTELQSILAKLNASVAVTGTVGVSNAFALEATLQSVKTAVETIDNFISGSRGLVTEDNSAAILAAVDGLEAALATLNAKDFATQTTLALIKAKTDNLDAALSTLATAAGQATQATAARQDTGNTSLGSIDTKLTSQATAANQATGNASLATLVGQTDAVEGSLASIAAEDFATETTLATRLAEATFTARINTQGQKTMAASTPVVLASDQSSLPVVAGGAATVTDERVEVTAPGVPVQFPTVSSIEAVVTADPGNRDVVVIGTSTVVAAPNYRRGVPLWPGDSASFPVSNLNKLYMDGRTRGDSVSYAVLAA